MTIPAISKLALSVNQSNRHRVSDTALVSDTLFECQRQAKWVSDTNPVSDTRTARFHSPAPRQTATVADRVSAKR
jgi:hypothetical protein